MNTEFLAVWGAASGTVGTVVAVISLLLRFKQHKKDQPILRCESNFDLSHGYKGAGCSKKLTIRSLGKRPVTLDFVKYYIQPKKLKHRLVRSFLWRTNRFIWRQDFTSDISLQEGKKAELDIRLHESVDLLSIRKVTVVDQTGKEWSVNWPNLKSLKSKLDCTLLHWEEDKTIDTPFSLCCYTVDGKYYIRADWTPSGSKRNRKHDLVVFNNKKACETKLAEVKDTVLPELLDGNMQSIPR